MAHNKEIWLSRGEIEGLLQGSLTWTDVYPRPVWSDPSAQSGQGSQSVRSAEPEESTVAVVRVGGFLAATAGLTLMSWVYFVFAT
ncbi:MAG: hypothetical protein QMC95_03890 [Desulfitobacteriaceae bacterium]|nr:hypothetical protein [Desulfitobacteriaceae bacterium]MDI6878911.1 hypothetical protein [Desulfitobacteriaceae bacterium]MDI6913342.1 hypothetical protein [Desulfitobacteriaceae bacterium]